MRQRDILGCTTERGYFTNNSKCFIPKNSFNNYEIMNNMGTTNSKKEDYDAFLLEEDELEEIKTKIKNIDWDSISNDWTIKHYKNQNSVYEIIYLDPYQVCSKKNPLYRKKEWLERIYNDKELQLDDQLIGQICGMHKSSIRKWRKKYNIETKPKGPGIWIEKKNGRVRRIMPKDYNHPELIPWSNGRYVRQEHTWIMEQFLANNPELDISKKCLIDGKYLKSDCEVHHVNQIPNHNNIENLWAYENKKAHAEGELTLYDVLKNLIELKQIVFDDGIYYLDKYFDYRDLSSKEIRRILKTNYRKKPINFKDLNLVRDEIKKIDWYRLTNDWTVKESLNQFVEKTTPVNPYKDCSQENPLFKHKIWVETLIKDKRFNLTDSRLGKLCGISKDKARYWRDKAHKIKGKTDWGYDRIIDPTDGRIWRKVPNDYENPVVKKDNHQRKFMLEHRYLLERYLAKHLELDISKKSLINGKYLKSEYQVHHINLDCQDNRLENFWVFENSKNHHKAIRSLYNLVDELLKFDYIAFKKGKYYLSK